MRIASVFDRERFFCSRLTARMGVQLSATRSPYASVGWGTRRGQAAPDNHPKHLGCNDLELIMTQISFSAAGLQSNLIAATSTKTCLRVQASWIQTNTRRGSRWASGSLSPSTCTPIFSTVSTRAIYGTRKCPYQDSCPRCGTSCPRMTATPWKSMPSTR